MSAAEETEQAAQAEDAATGEGGGPRIEVRGDASAEQVAALVAVLSGLGGGDEEEDTPTQPPSRWSSRERLVRAPVHPSRGGWRASGLPR